MYEWFSWLKQALSSGDHYKIQDSNQSWANVGPTSGRQCRRCANVRPTYIAVWDFFLTNSTIPNSNHQFPLQAEACLFILHLYLNVFPQLQTCLTAFVECSICVCLWSPVLNANVLLHVVHVLLFSISETCSWKAMIRAFKSFLCTYDDLHCSHLFFFSC